MIRRYVTARPWTQWAVSILVGGAFGIVLMLAWIWAVNR